MGEFEELEDLDAVAQGDVIKWIGNDWTRPWQSFGVVVTADCDLARDKHGGVVSYVPAMLTEDFVWQKWRIDRIDGKLNDLLATAGQRIGKWRSKREGDVEAPSPAAMRRWLERSEPNEILAELGVTDNGERNNLLNVLEPAFTVLGAANCSSPDLTLLSAAYSVINPKAVSNPGAMAEDVQKSWSGLPGDVFHIPSMPDSEATPGEGLFLHLRHIRQIDGGELTARPDAVRNGRARALRIARISAPFRYAMTQALARVFSDIGLPEAYEMRCKSAAQSFFQREATA